MDNKQIKEGYWVKIMRKNGKYFLEEPRHAANQSIQIKQDTLLFMWGQQPTIHKILKEQNIGGIITYTLDSNAEELKNSIMTFKPIKENPDILSVLWQKKDQEQILKAYFTLHKNAYKFENIGRSEGEVK